MRNIGQVASRAWNALSPTSGLMSRILGSHYNYCHGCDRFHTDGCTPWRDS